MQPIHKLFRLYLLYEHFKELTKRKKKRRFGVRPFFKKRNTEGEYVRVFLPLIRGDPVRFIRYTRLEKSVFKLLLSKIKNRISSSAINSIRPELQLVITLRYLGTGLNFRQLEHSFLVAHETISVIVRRTCAAIWEALHNEYIRLPRTPDEWREKAVEYEQTWQTPHAIASLDGKHVHIRAPPHSATKCFNYKKTFSIVLMALVDAKYNLLFADIGQYGSSNDSSIFATSKLKQLLDSGKLGLPPAAPLNEEKFDLPYHILADSAFPLSPNLMKPFSGKELPENKLIFNYRLSRGRRTVENFFGLITAKWRCLRSPLEVDASEREDGDASTADLIVKAICCLHNFNMAHSPPRFNDQQLLDRPLENGEINDGYWRKLRFSNTGIADFQQVIHPHATRS